MRLFGPLLRQDEGQHTLRVPLTEVEADQHDCQHAIQESKCRWTYEARVPTPESVPERLFFFFARPMAGFSGVEVIHLDPEDLLMHAISTERLQAMISRAYACDV